MQFCPWEGAQYLIYSSNVPRLLFYSHIPATIVALLVGFLVFYKSGKSKIGTTLLIINILFSVWCIFDLILWATNRPDMVIFFWSMQVLIEPLIYLLGLYLAYLFINKDDLPLKFKILIMLLYSPIVVLLSTNYNLLGINLPDCTAIENFIAQYFTYMVEFVSIVSILVLTDRGYRKSIDPSRKKEILTFGIGIIVFLLAFSWGNLIGSFTDNWTIAQIGLIGMPIFVGFLAYLIVKFHTFNIKLFATQAFVWGLSILIGSQFFFIRTPINRVLNGITFIASIIFGYLLIQSVKREIKQKEQLEKLNIELKTLIQQRESLVHLVTHKVKGSFTRSKYIFAGILDGTFGEINGEVKKRAEQGLESDNMGIETVDLVLNVANMQKGIVKYEMKSIDLKDIILKTLSEKRSSIEAKGLQVETNIKDGMYTVLGDSFWLKEAVSNLVENSIKYTKEGSIVVGLDKKDGKALVYVKDTGIGITDADKSNLFTEGGRGKDSVKVNVDSTGYGLYSVKLIIEAHHGRVWAESEGPGKGSTFFIELPLI
jgi:signal transduction histidine kinase